MRVSNTSEIKNLIQKANPNVSKVDIPQKGDIIEGKIVNSNQLSVDVLLANGERLKASIKGNLFFNIGDKVKFVVQSSDTSKLVLSGLTTNAIENKLIEVLENAGVRVNEKNLSIVKNLFENNMPVNKETVSNLARLSSKYPDISTKLLVSMQKSGMEINPKNVEIIRQVVTGEKPVFNSVSDFAKALSKVFEDGSNSEVKTEGVPEKIVSDKTLTRTEIPEEKAGAKLDLNIKQEEKSSNEQAIKGENAIKDLPKPEIKTLNLEKAIRLTGSEDSSKTLELKLNQIFTKEEAKALATKVSSELKPESRAQFRGAIKEAFEKGSSVEDFLKSIDEKGIKKETVVKIFTKQILENKVEKKLYIKPSELSKEEVKNTIKSTNKFIERSLKLENTPELREKAVKLAETIKTLDKLSQDYNFVHIPLIIDDKKSNSELYMYKKKSKKDAKQSLKALLRLDFVNLGHLDIILEKQSKNINLSFYSEDDLDDVKESISVLRKELSDIGYILSDCIYNKQEEKKNLNDFFEGIEEFVAKDEKQAIKFDMRA